MAPRELKPLFDARGRVHPARMRTVLAHLRREDPRLGQLIDRVGPLTLSLQTVQDPFRALARAIVGQQISGKAAQSIWNRLEHTLEHAPPPGARAVLEAPEAVLRACGVSRGKVLALKDLAAKVMDATVPPLDQLHAMPDEQIVERLTSIRGVGPWTVQMMLIFRLGRTDVMPSTDYGVRKGFGQWFLKGALPTPGQVERRGQRWRPYRSIGAWYLWRALELA